MEVFGLDLEVGCIVMMERPSRTLEEKRIRNIAHFFDVKKFPFSTIAITRVASINVEDKEITGNLTIKGITHPVTFPVKMEMKDGIVKASASGKLVIDRTKWDVRYNSGKFFDNLKDQAISDSIEFNIKIVAKK